MTEERNQEGAWLRGNNNKTTITGIMNARNRKRLVMVGTSREGILPASTRRQVKFINALSVMYYEQITNIYHGMQRNEDSLPVARQPTTLESMSNR